MTPTFCCGFECGRIGTNAHVTTTGVGTPTIDTTIKRNGARSLRCNASGAAVTGRTDPSIAISTSLFVGRIAVYFATLPGADSRILSNSSCSIRFKQSDSKLYPAVEGAMGTEGFSITTGVWYVIDWQFENVAGIVTATMRVNGTPLTAKSGGGDISLGYIVMGIHDTTTGDVYFDDLVISETSGDYPIGDGYVNHFVPIADGTHNIAGANDFERSTSGTDITNATTDAYTLIDDVPLKATSPTEFVNMIAPPNATDYTEHIFGPASGISTPTTGPRAVEVIALVAQSGTGTGNMELRLNDNGSMGIIYTATGVAGIVAGKYVRAHFADPPSAASAWTAVSGNGNFNDVRVRFGSPAALDVNPDQYLASIMIEAEFATVSPPVGKLLRINQAVNRSATY